MKFEEIGGGVYMLNTASGSAVVQLGGMDHSFGSGLAYAQQIDGLDHVRWGPMDNQPNIMKNLARANNQVQPLLNAKRDLTYAGGLAFFQREIVDKKLSMVPYIDQRIEDWLYAEDVNQYLISAINQYMDMGNVFARMTYKPLQDWYKLEVSDCFFTRIGIPEKGRITNYKYNPYFGDMLYYAEAEVETETIRAFDFENAENNRKNVVSILHCKDAIAGNPYYSYPSWWCSKEWIELANLIPLFHKSGIKNGYNIKYLIKMPKDYFDPSGKTLDEKESKKRWADFGANLDKWMAGDENVNKTMLVKYLRGSDGKAQDNVDVIPLKNEMSDTAYSTVWEMANVSIANGMEVTPTVAGVNPGKGNDSGSQIRAMAEFHSQFRTAVTREHILKPIKYALREMGYTDVVPAFKEIQLTTLDVNPMGKQAVVQS
jgi:hypothetical protein